MSAKYDNRNTSSALGKIRNDVKKCKRTRKSEVWGWSTRSSFFLTARRNRINKCLQFFNSFAFIKLNGFHSRCHSGGFVRWRCCRRRRLSVRRSRAIVRKIGIECDETPRYAFGYDMFAAPPNICCVFISIIFFASFEVFLFLFLRKYRFPSKKIKL